MEERILVFRAADHLMGSCLIRIDARLQLVIVSWPEQVRNQSRSIEAVMAELLSSYPLKPGRLLLIEHFPQDNKLRPAGDTFYLINLTWDKQQLKSLARIPLSNMTVYQLLSCLKTPIE